MTITSTFPEFKLLAVWGMLEGLVCMIFEHAGCHSWGWQWGFLNEGVPVFSPPGPFITECRPLLKLAEKRKTTRIKAETTRLKECQDDEVWRKVTEGDGTMWQRFDEEEKCWRVWGGRKTGVIRRWRTRPQLMCCALTCGTRCPLISGAWKTMRMTKNKARMYRF